MKSMLDNYRVIIEDRVKFDNLSMKQIERLMREYRTVKYEIEQQFVDRQSNLRGYMTIRRNPNEVLEKV